MNTNDDSFTDNIEDSFFSNSVPNKFSEVYLKDCLYGDTDGLMQIGKDWAENPCSLYIFGETGTGKTWLAFALLREMFRRCKSPIQAKYISSTDLAMKLSNNSGYLVNIISSQLLVIDDFCLENKNENIINYYFHLLNYRYSHELPTVIIGKYLLCDIAEIFSEEIASRMFRWKIIALHGPDFRKELRKRTEFDLTDA